MSDQGNAAIRAGQVAESQGMWLHKNARFIDPWKTAASKISRAVADKGAIRGRTLQPRTVKGLGLLANLLERGAVRREDIRWHTPQEFQDPFDQAPQNGQPGERRLEESAGGNLSREQFGGNDQGGLGRQGPFGRPGSQPL